MIQKTEAIVLKRNEFRETSLVVTLYTPNFGKIKGLVKGIRGRENRHEGILDLASVNHIIFYEKANVELYLISQVELKECWQGLSARLGRLLFAQYLLEEVDGLVPLRDPDPELYQFLCESLQNLCHQTNFQTAEQVVRYFEIQVIRHLGFLPRLDCCLNCQDSVHEKIWMSLTRGGVLCRKCYSTEIFAEPLSLETTNTLNQLVNADRLNFQNVYYPLTVRQELGKILKEIVEYHMEKPIRSVRVLNEFSGSYF